jgi:hypothetical protein
MGDSIMDNAILKKRLNTYKSSDGRLRHVSDEIVLDVLRAWEHWQGTSASLYREIGLSKMQLLIMIKKAKKLVKSGVVTESEFKEVKVEGMSEQSVPLQDGQSIEVTWEQGKVIRFHHVEQLVDFLKRVA